MSQNNSQLLDADAVTERLFQVIADRHAEATSRPPVLCISGAQGSGKSTLSAKLEARLRTSGRHGVVLSLDDFYLTQAERQSLAREVHPLAARRGPPGTHDTRRLMSTLEMLRSGSAAPIELPRFDKASDDRSSESVRWEGPAAWIIIEGWCLGLSCAEPCLEEDACSIYQMPGSQAWRAWVDEELRGDWAMLDQLFDYKAYLKLPDFESIVDARWRQEETLYARTGRRQFTARSEISDFVSLYEPWTLRMAATAHRWADDVYAVEPGFTYRLNV